MRKLTSLFFLLLAVVIHAQQITPDEAEAIAAEFLNSSPRPAAKRVTVKRAKAKSDVDENQSSPYYIFNADDNQGFVIIAGDKRAKKILGYADTGNFDFNNLPPQLAAMLEQYAEQIKALPESAPTDQSWSTPVRAVSTDEGKLLKTANWGQGYPYNLHTPVIDGEHCPTGCVATAMAIVMKYYNWPESYDWDAMPLESPENPIESLSKLMTDAGEAVYMEYNLNESGAYMNWVGHKLQQMFRFSPECQYITQMNFSDEEWESILKSNLDNNEPVIYNGLGETGNHAFIIDGYTDDTYHINWGWDGVCNGYFYLNTLAPNKYQDFSSDCGMVINIVPDRSGKEYSNCFVDYGYFFIVGWAAGAHFSIDSPKQNQEFDYTCHHISYPCNESGQIGLLLYDKDGNVKEVLKSNVFTENELGSIQNASYHGIYSSDIIFTGLNISSETFPDDYITLATRKSTTAPWLEVLGTIEAPIKMTIADIKKDVGTVTIINNVPDIILEQLDDQDWIPIKDNIIECVIGYAFKIRSSIIDESIIIKVEGESPCGNPQLFYYSAGLTVYARDYTVTIDKAIMGIEKHVELVEAGTLQETLKDTQLAGIEMLTITGYINAADIWFIRENMKALKYLDIYDTSIMACNAVDPVEMYRINGSEQLKDALPPFALIGLTKLNSLRLPKELVYMETNSLVELAIEQIEIPATVQSIETNVFLNCTRLNTIISRMPQPPVIDDYVFSNTMCPSNGVLYVPSGSVEIYRQARVWQDFDQIVEGDGSSISDKHIIHEGLKYRVHGDVLYLVGYEQSQLPDDVVIPDKILINDIEYSVLGIDDNAMQFSQINSFVMSNTICTIGQHLFEGSTVNRVKMSDNIKYLPLWCIDGFNIEELHISENAESIGNSISCISLKKLHLPKKLHSVPGYEGSIGGEFYRLEEITVDPENEEWRVHDGVLYWKGLSHMILAPNAFTGELIIPDETTDLKNIWHCYNIEKIVLGNSVKSLNHYSIYNCDNLKHIEFNKDILFASDRVLCDLPCLESFTIHDLLWSTHNCFSNLPSLKYVYLLNENIVDIGNSFYENVNPNHDYFSSSINPQVTVPDGCRLYVPGGVKTSRSSNNKLAEMWNYEIDKNKGIVIIEPLIDGIVIDEVIINGNHHEAITNNFYEYDQDSTSDLDVIVKFTLHERQQMTTHYDAEFNASIPSSGIDATYTDDDSVVDVYSTAGVLLKKGCDKAQLRLLAPGIYILRSDNEVSKVIVK